MRSRIGLIGLALFLVVPVACTAPVDDVGPPQLYIFPKHRDLGQILLERGSQPVHFKLVNRGHSDLRITHLRKTCGCADVSLTTTVLPPGGHSRLSLSISPTARGNRTAYVTIHSNDQQQPRQSVSAAWHGVGPVEFDPVSVNFGTVLPSQAASRTVRLLRPTAGKERPTCRIDRVECFPPAHIRATVVDRATTGTLDSERIQVFLVAGDKTGERTGRILIFFNDCTPSTASIPLSWRVQDVVEATPSSLYLGSGTSGQLSKHTVVLSAHRDEQLTIAKLRLKEHAMACTLSWQRVNQTVIVITIEVMWPQTTGVYQDELRIDCTSPETRTVIVPLSGYVDPIE